MDMVYLKHINKVLKPYSLCNSDQEKDLLVMLGVFLGVMMMFVLWLFVLESIEVKVHQTLAGFSDANVARAVQAVDFSLAASNSQT